MAKKMAHRDHGGGVDNAMLQWGGNRSDWLDLSTGINPTPYPVPQITDHSWSALPDTGAQHALMDAARAFWNVPRGAAILAAPGASSIIARLPAVLGAKSGAEPKCVDIPAPTYNEHAAAYAAQGWNVSADAKHTDARVLVHPNNPTGRFWAASDINGPDAAPVTVIDESFCDVAPEQSLIEHAGEDTIILKSFGKFWGLAGLRLGFVIAGPKLIARLSDLTGPWAVSGPALQIGAAALQDTNWATATRASLTQEAARLDQLVCAKGAALVGGCSLFRLYEVDDAAAWQQKLAQRHVWSRIFPYSKTYLRLGLPASDRWAQLEAAL